VLNNNKSYAAARRNVPDKLLQSLEAPSRRADADDGKRTLRERPDTSRGTFFLWALRFGFILHINKAMRAQHFSA
jgi:hypothetical protein